MGDIEKRIQEKEEEFEGTRRNHNKQLEQMQFNIESESKAKAEAMRMRKKLELDIGELESALEHAHLANLELQKNIKSYQDKIRDKTMQFESEQVSKEKPILFKMPWKKPKPCLNKLIEQEKWLNKSYQ